MFYGNRLQPSHHWFKGIYAVDQPCYLDINISYLLTLGTEVFIFNLYIVLCILLYGMGTPHY